MIVLGGHPFEWEVGTPTAVTIGVFDGVHVGHKKVIRDLVELSLKEGSTPTVVTFDPHPLSILMPERAPEMLTTVRQRIEQFRNLGVGIVGVLNFPDIRDLTAFEFCEFVLSRGLSASQVVVGADFRFGRDRGGDAGVMVAAGERLGFGVSVIDLFGNPDGVVSSTRIRQLLAEGRVVEANALLSRSFQLEGRVMAGAGRGATIGFPTANVRMAPGLLIPGNGVYACVANIGEVAKAAVTNIGTRPTFGAGERTVEAHLLDYEGDLYDREIGLNFLDRLRDEHRFESVTDLVAQIGRDVERARQLLGDLGAGTAATIRVVPGNSQV